MGSGIGPIYELIQEKLAVLRAHIVEEQEKRRKRNMTIIKFAIIGFVLGVIIGYITFKFFEFLLN